MIDQQGVYCSEQGFKLSRVAKVAPTITMTVLCLNYINHPF